MSDTSSLPVVDRPHLIKRKSVREGVQLPWRIYKVVMDGPPGEREKVELYAGSVETEEMANALIFGFDLRHPDHLDENRRVKVGVTIVSGEISEAEVPSGLVLEVLRDGKYDGYTEDFKRPEKT